MTNTEINVMLKSANSFEELLKQLETFLENELGMRPLRIYSCGAEGTVVDSVNGILAKSCREGTPIIIPDISRENHFNPSSDNPENLKIKSLLTYPLEFEGKKMAIVVLWGLEGHVEEEERLVPLKSGSETIGVTVKKEKVEYPERIMTEEDIEKIEFILGDFSKRIYSKFFKVNLDERVDNKENSEIEIEKVSKATGNDTFHETDKGILEREKEKNNTEKIGDVGPSSWLGKIKSVFLGRK